MASFLGRGSGGSLPALSVGQGGSRIESKAFEPNGSGQMKGARRLPLRIATMNMRLRI